VDDDNADDQEDAEDAEEDLEEDEEDDTPLVPPKKKAKPSDPAADGENRTPNGVGHMTMEEVLAKHPTAKELHLGRFRAHVLLHAQSQFKHFDSSGPTISLQWIISTSMQSLFGAHVF
jgi:hypothetical protein